MQLRRPFKILALCVFGPLCLAIAHHVIQMQTDPTYRQRMERDRAERQRYERQVEEAKRIQQEKEKFAKEHDTTWAYTMSKQFIRQKLKSPASAEFPWAGTEDVQVSKTGDAKYIVSAYVDAQNSFGAKLRSRWICELEYLGNKNWRATPTACGLIE